MAEKLIMSNTVKAILMLLVIAAVIFIFPTQLNAIYKSIRGYDDLKQSDKELIDTNINNFVNVAQECRKINDEQCLCKNALKNFPDTFRKEITIEIQQDKNAILIPKFNKVPIEGKNTTIEMTGFSYVQYPGEEKSRVGVTGVLLKFDKDSPYIEIGKGISLISGNLYKGTSSPSTLYFIALSSEASPLSIVLQKEFFSNLPRCFDKRQEAITQFGAFIAELKTLDKDKEITINLTENYRIFYGGKVIKLYYNEEEVKRIVNNKLEIVGDTNYPSNVKCSEPAIKDYLSARDKINVTKTADGFCIKRI